MKASLAYIHEGAARTVAALQEAPRGPVPIARIAGIEVLDIDAKVSVDASVQKAADAYLADVAALKKKLDDAGVTTLAILPTRTWRAMIRESGLYRFAPQDDGSVRVSTDSLKLIAAQALSILGLRTLIAQAGGFVLGFAATFCLLAFTFGVSAGWAALAGIPAAIFGGWSLGSLAELRYFRMSVPRPERLAPIEHSLIRKLLDGEGAAPQALWPNQEEPETGPRLRIRLPAAPHEMQANLLRARKAELNLTLNVVAEAIVFEDDPIMVLTDARGEEHKQLHAEIARRQEAARIERERLRYERMLQRDPIVETSLGTATAVIVQYGDFPIEREVVDRIFERDNLV